MNRIRKLLCSDQFRELFIYAVVGVLTTIINYAVYFAVTRVGAVIASIPADVIKDNTVLVQAGNIAGWVLSVLFAFFANKRYVFRSADWSGKTLKREIPGFVSARVLSLAFDAAFMQLNTSLFHMDDLIAKLISNVIVIVLNYFASKFWIFKKKNDKEN